MESSSSIIVADGYNESFRGENFTSTIGNVYVGNHTQLVSTITPDPDAFFGTIDQIKFYKNPLSDDRFDSHVQYVDAYDINEVEYLKENLLVHLKFNTPQNLFTGSTSQSLSDGYVSIPNNASTQSISDIRAYNFPNLNKQEEFEDCDNCCLQFLKLLLVSSSFHGISENLKQLKL